VDANLLSVQAQLKALADPTRRRILELVADRELPVGAIAEEFPVSRPAISQHIGVLRDAGLVTERREGTRRLYAADPSGLVGIREFLDRFWQVRLQDLKNAAEAAHQAGHQTGQDEGTSEGGNR
jgi:DNA-binding transcriptional ArsR family regulator